VRSKEIRKKTGLQKLELIIRERRLEVAGTRIRNRELQNTSSDYTVATEPGYKRKPGWPRKNWMDIIGQDLKDMDTTWDEAEELARDRAEWHQRVAQCSHLTECKFFLVFFLVF